MEVLNSTNGETFERDENYKSRFQNFRKEYGFLRNEDFKSSNGNA